ncbi:MAG: hypothetical protein HYZ08_02960 [Candidatus Kerfeldbacteria bacterium]|nr:hypothetical protein [Candidatus Kerfeldbacteria bacterium]
MKFVVNIGLGTLIILATAWSAQPTDAAALTSRKTIQMMQENVDRGYTMEFLDGKFTVGMTPRLFSEPVRLTQREVEMDEEDVEIKSKRLVSNIYEFNFRGAEMNPDRPVWIAIKSEEDLNPYLQYRIHVYDRNADTWTPLPTTLDRTHGKLQSAIHTSFARIAVFEEKQLRTTITKHQRTNGFEFSDSFGEFGLAVFPNTFSKDQRLRIKRRDPADYPTPENTTRVSAAVFEYGIASDDPIPDRPLGVRISYTPSKDSSRSIYIWSENTWKKLDSKDNTSTHWISTNVPHAHAILAVFENAESYTGTASFYRARNADDAATHLFPIGTRLLVTNRDTGQSTIVTVRSTWGNANHPTRIIDLSRSAFDAIGDLSQGLISVRIEPAD